MLVRNRPFNLPTAVQHSNVKRRAFLNFLDCYSLPSKIISSNFALQIFACRGENLVVSWRNSSDGQSCCTRSWTPNCGSYNESSPFAMRITHARPEMGICCEIAPSPFCGPTCTEERIWFLCGPPCKQKRIRCNPLGPFRGAPCMEFGFCSFYADHPVRRDYDSFRPPCLGAHA